MPDACPLTSCLELLPDELWLLILAHLSPTDRLYSFGNINSRLNAILREAGAGLDDELASNSCSLHELSPCITFVKLQRRCHILDLYRLVNVRSLTILHTMQHQITDIESMYLPHLTHLRLTSPSNALDARYGRLLELILNQHFQSLVSVHLPQAHFFGIYNCVGHSGLRNATIGSCRSDRFGNLISLMPNIRYLEIRHLINWPISQKVTHSKIYHLKLHIDTLNIDDREIDALKTLLPSLQHVTIVELMAKQFQCVSLTPYDTTSDFPPDEDPDDF